MLQQEDEREKGPVDREKALAEFRARQQERNKILETDGNEDLRRARGDALAEAAAVAKVPFFDWGMGKEPYVAPSSSNRMVG